MTQTIAEMINEVLCIREQSVLGASIQIGVNRNFLMDLIDGKVPRARAGSRSASNDPRYKKVAAWLGHDELEFVRLVEAQQYRKSEVSTEARRVGGSLLNITPEGVVITITRDTFQVAPTTLSAEFAGLKVTVTIERLKP